MDSLESEIQIKAGKVVLNGNLSIPKEVKGIIIFAHGSGSSRFSPRNRFVAESLQKEGIATLLIDLLTSEEDKVDNVTGEFRFDITLLAERLIYATKYVQKEPSTKNLSIGYFGASTGAAAALVAAAKLPKVISAIVSRGGRPDLAGKALGQVKTSTLLVVGGEDHVVIELNRQALKQLEDAGNKRLVIIPGATHLFEEPGTLSKVARLATEWFRKYL